MLRWAYRAYPVLAFSLIASSVIIVHIICDATATTWLGWAMIQSILFLNFPSIHSLNPKHIILLTEISISFCNKPNHCYTPFFAVTVDLNKTLSFYGEYIPQIKFVSDVLFPSIMYNFTKASKHFPRYCSTISKFPAFERIYKSSSLDKK